MAVNLPGPVAASRLTTMGASVAKVEPPGGDPLARMCPGYYAELGAGQEVMSLDLTDEEDRASLDERLASTPVGVKRIRLAARAVEREHQLGPETLAQRLGGDEAFELADELRSAPRREVRLDAVLQRVQA